MRFRLRRKPKEHTAAISAILDAEKHLREVKARAPEVAEVARETREIRARNHFAEQLTEMMTPRPRKRA